MFQLCHGTGYIVLKVVVGTAPWLTGLLVNSVWHAHSRFFSFGKSLRIPKRFWQRWQRQLKCWKSWNALDSPSCLCADVILVSFVKRMHHNLFFTCCLGRECIWSVRPFSEQDLWFTPTQLVPCCSVFTFCGNSQQPERKWLKEVVNTAVIFCITCVSVGSQKEVTVPGVEAITGERSVCFRWRNRNQKYSSSDTRHCKAACLLAKFPIPILPRRRQQLCRNGNSSYTASEENSRGWVWSALPGKSLLSL